LDTELLDGVHESLEGVLDALFVDPLFGFEGEGDEVLEVGEDVVGEVEEVCFASGSQTKGVRRREGREKEAEKEKEKEKKENEKEKEKKEKERKECIRCWGGEKRFDVHQIGAKFC
jgi:hypothetical protein